jgi:hypothetical protein
MKRCSATTHAALARGMKTMIAKGNTGVAVRGLLQPKCKRQQPEQKNGDSKRDQI